MRCEIHCPRESGAVVQALAMGAAVFAAVYVLWQLAVILAVLGAAALVLAGVSVPVLRWSRRLCVPRWSAWHPVDLPRRAAVPDRVTARAALPAPPRAIEAAPLPGTVVTLTARDYERMPS